MTTSRKACPPTWTAVGYPPSAPRTSPQPFSTGLSLACCIWPLSAMYAPHACRNQVPFAGPPTTGLTPGVKSELVLKTYFLKNELVSEWRVTYIFHVSEWPHWEPYAHNCHGLEDPQRSWREPHCGFEEWPVCDPWPGGSTTCLPWKGLCFGVFINSASFALKSVLFRKIYQLVSMSWIEQGLNSIIDLPRAACSFSTRRLIGVDCLLSCATATQTLCPLPPDHSL